MSKLVFEAFKFNEQLEILTTPLEADYRLRGKIEPGLPGSSLESRALFIEKLVNGDPNFFPIDAFQVETEECPVCATLQRTRTKPHLLLHCPKCQGPAHSWGSNTTNPEIWNKSFLCQNCGHRFSLRNSAEYLLFTIQWARRGYLLLALGIPEMRIHATWGISRHLLETIRAALIEKLKLPEPGKTEYPVAVLIIDGVYPNGLSRLIAIVENQIFWMNAGESQLEIQALLNYVKRYVTSKQWIIISDGKPEYVTPVRNTFPECVHIRHFHDTWKEALIHFPHQGEIYTLHCETSLLLKGENAQVTLWKGEKRKRPSKPQATVNETQLYRIGKLIDRLNSAAEKENHPRSGEKKKTLGALIGALTRALRAALKTGKTSPTEILEQLKHLQVEKLPKKHQRIVQERIRELQEAHTTTTPAEEESEMGEDGEEVEEEEGGEKEEGEGGGKDYVVKRVRKIFEGRVGDAEGEVKEIIDQLLEKLKPLKGKHLVNSRCEGIHTLFIFLLACQRCASDDTLTLMMLWCFNPKHIEEALFQCLSHLSSKLIRRGTPFRWEVGKTYLIRYRSRKGKPGWRKIRVKEVTKKHIKAHCFKKGETRHFRRKRTAMEKVIPLHKSADVQKPASPPRIFWGWINSSTPT